MKNIYFLIAFCFSALTVSAQIKFNDTAHDFGTINEGEQSSFRFQFKNLGKKPVMLKEVKASCGCTTPNYTKREVAGGDTGSVLVTYNSKGRPGQFAKTVTVVYDTTQAPIILNIKGDVKSAPTQNGGHNHDGHNHDGHNHDGHNHDGHNHDHSQASLQTAIPSHVQPSTTYYPDTIGRLAFERVIETGVTLLGDKDNEFTFKIRNVQDKPIKITEKTESKVAFQFVAQDKVLAPGQESIVKVKYLHTKAKDANLAATIRESISFFTDEATNNKKELIIEGVYQKKLTDAEIAAAPKIQFAQPDFDAGEILAGEELVHKYVFTNIGKSDLIIESAKASCGCTVPELKEKVIKPGQSSYVEAKFNSAGRVGAQHKTITVISNDPTTTRVTLNLKTLVKEDPFSVGDDTNKQLPLNDAGRSGGR